MYSKKLILTLVATLLIGSIPLLTAAAHADNPVLNLDANGNLVITPLTTTTTTEPAAPPPPPPAPATTTLTTPSVASTVPLFTPSDTAGHWPSGNITPHPHPPFPPYPRTTWPYTGYYPGSWPYNQYYTWGGTYPWVGTTSYPYYQYYPRVTVYQQPQPVYYAPVISSFTSNPNYIQSGQMATLSWNVSNADLISISPSVGSVAASGSFAVIPTYTTTYTLTATNNQGTVSASTTVTVAPYVASYSSYDTYGTGSTTTPSIAGTGTTSTGTTINTGGVSSGGSTTAVNLWLMYVLLIGLLAVAAAVIITLIVRKPAVARAGNYTHAGSSNIASATAPASTLSATSTPVTTPVEAGLPAKFVSPGGTTMPVTGRPLGRKDFQALISPEKADLISRKHVLVTYENSQYYIEDLNSTNGTKLNGSEIRGTGKHSIESGDTVELAGALNLTFKV